jgi:hypothetical protein
MNGAFRGPPVAEIGWVRYRRETTLEQKGPALGLDVSSYESNKRDQGSSVSRSCEGTRPTACLIVPRCTLERVQKRNQLLLLFRAEVHLEALIVEVH